MKLKEIYDLFVRSGIENDPRGAKAVKKLLDKTKKDYENLGEDEKKDFDKEKLTNPFADTRILYGDPGIEVKDILTGIDIESAEILLADRLREKGTLLDLVIAHHPEGRALANLDAVMPVQADIWSKFGVPINIGDALIEGRMKEVQRGFMPLNHTRPVDAARLLDIPFMCSHTAADNMVTTYLQTIFDDRDTETIKDVMGVLKEIPEYRMSGQSSIGPQVLVGSESKRAGRIMVDMTGGTGGPKMAIQKLADAGVGTFVGMHMSDKNREEAEKSHVNVVIAGHIASDSIGMNLLLDKIEAQGVSITTCSGLTRVKRS